ncbi:MAG: ACT domain-containing protein [Oscillospiraceae bacterium]|nr:ACT domain-containing protein [Oscillospiraceae bacterium]
MRAIMTVTGPDRVGIIASVSALLASLNINILDLSQTIMGGLFTMTLLVDTAAANRPFEEIRDALNTHGEKENLSIRIQREDTFVAMHKI